MREMHPNAQSAKPTPWTAYAGEAARGFARGFQSAWDEAVSGMSPEASAREAQAMWGKPKDLPPITSETSPVTAELEDWAVRRGPEFIGGMAVPSAGKVPEALVTGGLSSLEGRLGETIMPAPAAKARTTLQAARDVDRLQRSTLGLKTGSQTLQTFEKTIASAPGGKSILKAAQAQEQEVGMSAAELADRLAGGRGTTAEAAGGEIERGMKARVQQHREEGEALYQEVDRLVGPDHPVHMRSTLSAFEEAVTPPRPGVSPIRHPISGRAIEGSETAEAVSDKFLLGIHEKMVRDVAEHGYLPYADAKFIRQQLGAKIQTGVFATDAANGLYKKLYGALSTDMMRAASQAGDEAANAVRVANSRWKEIKDEQRILNTVLKGNGGPERVFASLMASGERRRMRGGGATLIRRVMAALPQRDQRLLAASAISEMGMALPSKASLTRSFSVDTFLTNWGRLSPEAKQAMFGTQVLGNRYANDMDRLVMNVDALRNYGRLLTNYSGTAPLWVAMAETQGAIQAVWMGHYRVAAGIAIAPLYTWATAQALTHPETVKWLADRSANVLMQVTRAGVLGHAGLQAADTATPEPKPYKAWQGWDMDMARGAGRDVLELSDMTGLSRLP
jgi:hypothetical protein